MPTPPPTQPLVAAVDHLLLHAADADALLDLFATRFGLPGPPMTVHADFASGVVNTGDVLVEVLRYSARLRWTPPPGTARIGGLALQPAGSVDETLALLTARGINHSEPVSPVPGITNVVLPELIPGHLVFLCQWADTVAGRRRAFAQQLRERDGGPVGIVGVKELVIAVADPAAATAHWQRLLAPTPVTIPGTVPLTAGPALRLEPSPEDGMARLVFRVKDLSRAATFLDQQGLLGERGNGRVSIRPERVQTLHLAFEEVSEDTSQRHP